MGFHLAVDGGNTKTVAVVLDEHAVVAGRGRDGCCDIYATPTPADGLAAVVAAVRRALADAGDPELRSAAFRLASCDWPEDLDWWSDRLRAELPEVAALPPSALVVGNDGLSTLRLADPSGVGVAVVVGTGPAIGARSPSGAEAWSGVWIFDNLAGIGLADAGLSAVAKSWLGIGPSTTLTAAFLEHFDEPDVWALIHGFRRRFGARSARELAAAARVVMRAAADGDRIAEGLVAAQGALFADYAQAIAAQAGIGTGDGLPVVLNGSVATSENSVIRDALIAQLSLRFPQSRLVIADAAPIAGVSLDALAADGVPLTDAVRAAVVAMAHPDGFLTT